MKATLPNGSVKEVRADSTPDCCPVCHHTGQMAQQGSAFIRFEGGWSHEEVLQLTFRCQRHKCGALFLAEFDYWRRNTSSGYELHRVFPLYPKKPDVPEEVGKISPAFVALYKQALSANHHGLEDLFGMGLRKSLEFLIKDYCIQAHPDKEAIIKKQFLGAVIKEFVSDQNIKTCAERASWLGNDETHYEKRWDTHDVNDLHTLLRLTMNWIQSEALTKKYLKEMQEKKEKNRPAPSEH
jgi:hypothetical protein